ncbi:hypothetical protein EDB83DRAFT_2180365, partial [Lactarius deliciosus]
GYATVSYFDPTSHQKVRVQMKCHCQMIDDVGHIWPINALAFHPTYNTFASSGSDATVSIWDHKVKQLL